MSSNREIRAGQTIDLRARFKDDLGDNAQASGVNISIYPPDTAEFIYANAYVSSGVATYLGEGIFEYQYGVPDTGPDGTWYDNWEGWLNGQHLSGEFTFDVSASGIIEQLPETQLYSNNVINITIKAGIAATDGAELEEDYEFSFMTVTSPAYTNIRKIQLETGGYTRNLDSDIIQTAILEASIEADTITFATTQENSDLYKHARRQYTTCLAAYMLLDNLGAGRLKSKTLDNLSVSYDTSGFVHTINRLRECMDRWTGQVISGGGAKVSQTPSSVIKGILDPDRPAVGRDWESTDLEFTSNQTSAGNYRGIPTGYRRNYTTYKKRWW